MKAIFKNLPIGYSLEIIHPYDLEDTRSCFDRFVQFSENNSIEMTLLPKDKNKLDSKINKKVKLVFVCGYYEIIKPEILKIPSLGFIGIHNSLLPKYRGFAPINWAIINDEKIIGSSVFRLEHGIDSGRVFYQVKTKVKIDDDINTISDRLEKYLIKIIQNNLEKIINGEIKYWLQDEKNATYFGKRSPVNGLIDWKSDSKAIHNFVRAQCYPYPGAYSFIEKTKINIEQTTILTKKHDFYPGRILTYNSKIIEVGVGQRQTIGIIKLRDFKLEHFSEFLRNNKIEGFKN